MLDCERWTLTHSSGGDVVPVLALPLPLLSGLGLVATVPTWASSVAAVPLDVAVEMADGDADVDGDADADGDGDTRRDGSGEAVLTGAAVALTGGGDTVGGSLADVEWLADELAEGDGEGEGDGERDGDGDGDGEGVGVPEEGSAWHTWSVFVLAAIGAACAVPSTPRVRKLPLSKVTAATLTCAKRIRIACLRCSSGLPCALRGFGGD